MILRELKNRAEERLGRPVSKAVITVPAQFSDAQRQATRDAGAIAGLEVLRIVNEPTAACLAYGKGGAEEGRNVLAFDLGGGTFDVSVVRVEGDVVEVISSHGDNRLGGDDMDQLIADWITQHVHAQQSKQAPLTTVSEHRVSRCAEIAKIHLTDHPHARIAEDSLETERGTMESINTEIPRSDFEEWIAPFVARTLAAVHKALADAGLPAGQIDEVILVGGATRVPAVQNALERELGKRPRRDVHPDLAVAYGAGVMAARLMGSLDHRVLVDITPYTFGTSAVGILEDRPTPYLFVPVIKSGTPLPVSKTEAFSTLHDEQGEVDVSVFQGESEDARQNTLIGRFLITGLSAVPAGNEIDMNMALDLDGILRVTAVEKMTGLSKDVQIENALAKLSEEDIACSRAQIREMFGEGPEPSGAEGSAPEPGRLLPGDRRTSEEFADRVAGARARMDEVDGRDADELLARLRDAEKASDTQAVGELSGQLEDLLFYVEAE